MRKEKFFLRNKKENNENLREINKNFLRKSRKVERKCPQKKIK